MIVVTAGLGVKRRLISGSHEIEVVLVGAHLSVLWREMILITRTSRRRIVIKVMTHESIVIEMK